MEYGKEAGVYLIENTINGRVYVGSTNNFRKRFTEHRTALQNNKHKNAFLQNDCNKCGIKAFNFIIVKITSLDEYFWFEQDFLDSLYDEQQNCYNLSPAVMNRTVGEKTKEKLRIKNLGRKMSEEAKEKMRAAKIGKIGRKISAEEKEKRRNRVFSEVTRQKIRDSKIGKARSEETKEKLRKLNSGKILSEATKEKIRQSLMGRIVSEETKEKLKSRQITQETKEKISRALTGRKFSDKEKSAHRGRVISDETRNKMKSAKIGKSLSESTKRKLSELRKGKKMSNEEKEKRSELRKQNPSLYGKRFRLLSPDGQIYEGTIIKDFCKEHNLLYESVTLVISGKRKQYKGWKNADLIQKNEDQQPS